MSHGVVPGKNTAKILIFWFWGHSDYAHVIVYCFIKALHEIFGVFSELQASESSLTLYLNKLEILNLFTKIDHMFLSLTHSLPHKEL